MNLTREIDASKNAAARIVAGLFALLGLKAGVVLGRIPRALHRNVLGILRPAESAVRRLIVVLARGVLVKTRASLPSHSRTPRSGDPGATGNRRNAGIQNTRATSTVYSHPWAPGSAFGRPGDVAAKKRNPQSSFKLFDARPPFRFATHTIKSGPRPQPRISFFHDGEARRISLAPEPAPRDEHVEAANLARRLLAVQAALDDLPGQARRLARALARRQRVSRLKLVGPLRPGRAPGFRRRALREVDHVLHRCDWLAREALPPDTS